MSAFLKSLDGLFKSQCYGIGVSFTGRGIYFCYFTKEKRLHVSIQENLLAFTKERKKKLKQASPSDINVEIAVRKYKFK